MPEVIPALVYVVGLFFAVVGYLAARGLLATWTHTIGYLLEALAGALVFSIPLTFGHKKIDLGGPVRALDHSIITAIQNWADGAEIEMVYCLHGLADVGRLTAEAIDFLARETERTFAWLHGIHLPRLTKVITTALFPWPAVYRFIRSEIAKALAHVHQLVKVVEHTLPAKTITIVKHAAAIPVAIPVAIPRLWRGIDDAETDIRKLMRRVTKTEALFGVTAMALAMANVLGIPNPRCLSKGPLGKISRALCGLGSEALNDILGLLVDVLIVEDICQVIVLLEDGLSLIQGPLNTFVNVVDGALCHGDYDAPPLLGPVTLSLPPSPSFSLSLP